MKPGKSVPERETLKRVQVRLLREEEREVFDALLESQHYLCSARLVGRTLRYVAELDGAWVALLCFSAAAFHLKAREKWIRLTPRQCARRLGFVVNNSRFLVLPERERLPNLAQRVLGLCLRRLSGDWQSRWGHPLLAVESFVDAIRSHWSAIENGVHHRRDVSLGEDACRVADQRASHVLATLRNLVIGLYEIQSSRDRVEANGLKSWCRRMTVSAALKLLRF